MFYFSFLSFQFSMSQVVDIYFVQLLALHCYSTMKEENTCQVRTHLNLNFESTMKAMVLPTSVSPLSKNWIDEAIT